MTAKRPLNFSVFAFHARFHPDFLSDNNGISSYELRYGDLIGCVAAIDSVSILKGF